MQRAMISIATRCRLLLCPTILLTLVFLRSTVTQLGWAAVACITGGLALTAVSNGRVSIVVGIIILAVVSFVITFFGLRVILVYEKYAWFVFFIIFLIIYGETGKYANNEWRYGKPSENGLAADCLTLIAIFYGSSASWCSMASDYYVHYPADVSRVKVFLMTTLGISMPTSFGMIAGVVVSSVGDHGRPLSMGC